MANNTKTAQDDHSFLSKWNILLENTKIGWILFQPQLGSVVYPCYSCRDIFSCKNSLLDHINRRSLDIRYQCTVCAHRFVFYNPCAFLQHVRQHFSTFGGKLDLAQVNIASLPFGMAGLLYDSKDFTVYDANDDEIVENASINSRFYNPVVEDKGKRFVRFHPKDLLFLSSINNNLSIPLVLKQISKNLPRCKFVTTTHLQTTQQPPPPKKPETKAQVARPVCPECKKPVLGTVMTHFLGMNQPCDERLECEVCKYIAPSNCSFQAHKRLHKKASPFICPDCGKTFESWQLLHKHLNHVCFHFVKRVNFRCPVLKCRKLFTMDKIFRRHFYAHFLTVYRCKLCKLFFPTEGREQHLNRHPANQDCLEVKYECLACKKHFNFADCPKHIEHHMPRREFYVYSYVCKWCHSKFKSTSTYGVHVKRCPKRVLELETAKETADVSNFRRKLCFAVCADCKTRTPVGFGALSRSSKCTGCGKNIAVVPVEEISRKETGAEAVIKCLLCREAIAQHEVIAHAHNCKYKRPVVKMSVYDRCKVDNAKKPATNEVTPPRKRKSVESEPPARFDGVYRCKICEFAHSDREQFRTHIVSHREQPTSYQCMECGDCFVVKLSLFRHLMYFHKIANPNQYLKENGCFDGLVGGGAATVVGEGEELRENQCSVCKREFSDECELRNHFRIHGMAFLNSSVK